MFKVVDGYFIIDVVSVIGLFFDVFVRNIVDFVIDGFEKFFVNIFISDDFIGFIIFINYDDDWCLFVDYFLENSLNWCSFRNCNDIM